ncbi:hypothetical protein [Microbulbifer taiwanensis]|uniref:hypothetical protein n=1 Tax=Microbulbifer taiwanensis TaxID=986746 RepID=UPI003608B27B
MHLAAPLQDIDPLLGGNDRVAVKIGGALLKLGEILDAFQGALGTEQALDIDAAQGRRIDAVAVLLRAYIADQVGGGVGVAIDVAVQAGDSWLGFIERLSQVALNCCCGKG